MITELCDDTKSGTATIQVTPRAVSLSTAAWIVARDAIPNATSVGCLFADPFATSDTCSFHCGWPPCASSRTPVVARQRDCAVASGRTKQRGESDDDDTNEHDERDPSDADFRVTN